MYAYRASVYAMEKKETLFPKFIPCETEKKNKNSNLTPPNSNLC